MKVSFPFLGYETIALKGFVEELGAEVVLPPLSKRTLELGVRYSPEMICLPFKITLGNFIEALERGAEVLLMAGGARKCRFGYYHYLQKHILSEMRNGFKFYALNQYTPYQFLFQKIPAIFSVKPLRVLKAFHRLIVKSDLIDDFKNLIRKLRALDYNYATKLEKRALGEIDKAKSIREMREVKNWLSKLSNEISPKRSKLKSLIKIGLVGEIYFLLENFANQEIEKELGKMGAWVWSKRSLSRWLRHLLKIEKDFLKIWYYAHHYLKDSPGGEAINTVGESIEFIKEGVDGIIHIFPFTCMPENIARAALEKISLDYNCPILSLSFDEHTSKTGVLTRIEAFLEVIKRRRYGSRVYRH